MSQIMEIASAYAFSELEKVGGVSTKLPLQLQTFVIVCSAQGIIDNGGFQYFFESDFSNQPPYSQFVNAYHRIGADDAANAIERAVVLFPFSAPHLYAAKRRTFLASLADASGIFDLEHFICGNQSVWDKLECYIKQNREIFNTS